MTTLSAPATSGLVDALERLDELLRDRVATLPFPPDPFHGLVLTPEDARELAATLAHEVLREMAGDVVARTHLAQIRGLGDAALRVAELPPQPAARVEAASGRRVRR